MTLAVTDPAAGSVGGRAAISRRRRTEIVRAAATVLGRKGSADTSMKEIAREAGVAPVSSTTTSSPRTTCCLPWPGSSTGS